MRLALASAATLLLTLSPAMARDPEWGGLGAVAVSPDGKTVATGGDNRVLYIVGAEKQDVQQRIWIKARVGGLAWSKDGTRLLLEDDDEVLHIFDTATWKEVTTVADVNEMSLAVNADIVIAIGSRPKANVKFLSVKDGSEKSHVDVAGRIATVGIDADGKSAFVLMEGVADATEKKLESKDTPKELNSQQKKEWEQRNDGKTAVLQWIDVAAGKVSSESKLWYAPRGRVHGFVSEGNACVLNYEDACGKINAKGEVTLFEVTSSYNYGRGSSPDHTMVVGGGLRGGALLKLGGGQPMKFELDKLPGWPEYWAGFTFGLDGTCWGVTSACRLVKISKDGKIEVAAPIF